MNQIGIFVWVSVKACSVGQYIHSIWHRLSLALTKNWRFKTWGFAQKGLNPAWGRGLQKAKLEICAENCISCKGWFIIFSMLEHVQLWILFTHFNGFSRQLDVAAEKNYFFFLEIWKYLCCLVGLGDLFAEHKQEQQKAKFPDQRQTSSKYFFDGQWLNDK